MDDRAREDEVGKGELALQRIELLEYPESRTLEAIARTQVVPRLARAGIAGTPATAIEARGSRALAPADLAPHIARLTDHVLDYDEDVARAHLAELLAEGVPVERIYAELLAPAACRLGDLWSEDRRDFTEVTVATWRLERLMRELAPRFRAARPRRASAPSILLAPTPGEQHTFGLHMVAEWFRRAAWQVTEEILTGSGGVAALVRAQHYDVVALSLGRDGGMDALAATIRTVRRASRNRGVAVLVGGPVFVAQPQLAVRTGADATAADAMSAVKQSELLLRAVEASQRSLML